MKRLILFALLSSATLSAQTYTAKTIHFSNLGDFTQAQLEDAAQIHTGTSFRTADLAAAAQRLVDTGLFDGVAATLDGRITAVTVLFDVRPIPKSHMLPVGFQNFVWLSHDELEAAIHARFPLFIDALPDNSPHQDDLRAALTDALAAKQITARVEYETLEPTLRHPIRQIAFRVASPNVRVSNIKLAGVTPATVPFVQKSVNATARTLYSEGPADQTTAERILAPLLEAGYAQAALTQVVPTPAAADANGNVPVVLSATLVPGELFHVSALTFPGTPLLSAEAFATSSKLHPGDLASSTALLQSLQPLDQAYRRQGYMDVVILAAPTFDDAAHTVAYAVSITPGEQYRIHEVTTNNLNPAAKAAFEESFQLKPGDLYNPDYVASYLYKASSGPQGGAAGFKAYAMPDTHTVDLVLTFAPSAR